VEDNEHDAFLIIDALIRSDGVEHDVTQVNDMEGLVTAFENKYFDLIISDYHMPKLKFTDVIKAIDYYGIKEIPLMIVSGTITQADASDMLGLKTAYMYISKNELWLLGPYVKQVMKTEENQFQIIQAFIYALEYRDINTREHSGRVVDLTLELAAKAGVRESLYRDLRISALLHDIGKIGVSDLILMKKGMLLDEEFEAMKLHCEFGYKLLSSIPQLKKYSTIAYCHHERWNGTGYPRGLMGTDIPIFARVFSVIDVYDALVSDRPYRVGWPVQKAIDYIKGEKGHSFDPDIVDAFISMMKERDEH